MGRACHDDRDLFERLILEGFQAGLSWSPSSASARHSSARSTDLIAESSPRYGPMMSLASSTTPGSSATDSRWLPRFRTPRRSSRRATSSAHSMRTSGNLRRSRAGRGQVSGRHSRHHAESDAMSKDLKRRGFRFVGSTICYAFMQSAGSGRRSRRELLPSRPAPSRPRP